VGKHAFYRATSVGPPCLAEISRGFGFFPEAPALISLNDRHEFALK
jgi:hypothetical protein